MESAICSWGLVEGGILQEEGTGKRGLFKARIKDRWERACPVLFSEDQGESQGTERLAKLGHALSTRAEN